MNLVAVIVLHRWLLDICGGKSLTSHWVVAYSCSDAGKGSVRIWNDVGELGGVGRTI